MTHTDERNPRDLLLSSSRGDMDAYSQLFNQYSVKLNNFIYYLTYSREESEDIVQDVFVRVYEAIQGRDVSGGFNFQAHLYTTARNLSLKAIERRKREGLTLEEATEFEDTSIYKDPQKAALLSDQRTRVKDASKDLTEDGEGKMSQDRIKKLEKLGFEWEPRTAPKQERSTR